MWWFDVDFAIFWALVIALLNYIPYVGSFLGMVLPVVLSLAKFYSAQTTIWLSAVQFYVGNTLESKLIGKGVNLSLFVVMVALSLWSAMWGMVGGGACHSTDVHDCHYLCDFAFHTPDCGAAGRQRGRIRSARDERRDLKKMAVCA